MFTKATYVNAAVPFETNDQMLAADLETIHSEFHLNREYRDRIVRISKSADRPAEIPFALVAELFKL